MSLKDLPGIGQNFSAKANIGGHYSLHTKLTHLSHQSGVLNVLKEDDVARITDKFDNPLIKKAIKYQGGLSEYQTKALKHKLTGDHLKDPHNFSAYKLKVAKQVVDHYKKSDAPSAPTLAPAEKPKPVLHLGRPPVGDTMSRHHVSANPLTQHQQSSRPGVGGSIPSKPHAPPPVRLVV